MTYLRPLARLWSAWGIYAKVDLGARAYPAKERYVLLNTITWRHLYGPPSRGSSGGSWTPL